MNDENGRTRPVGRTGSQMPNNYITSVTRVDDNLDGFTRGILADAYREGSRKWWLKRAEDFEKAKPRVGDFHGNATREELSRRWQWCHGVANACRAKAEMCRFDVEVEALLDDLGRAA